VTIFIDLDPFAPHKEDCGFWHGGACNCNEESRRALATKHCHECDYMNAFGMEARCNCQGKCICERLEGCPCVKEGIEP
jgi:hypothetical protein